MRRGLFFVALVVIVLAGAFIRFKENLFRNNADSIINALSIKGTTQPKNSGSTKVGGKWSTVLPGRWYFTFRSKSSNRVIIQQGEILYNADGTYKRFVTIKVFESPFNDGEVDFEDREDATYGGRVFGRWMADTGESWTELITACEIKQSSLARTAARIDPCAFYGDRKLYGTGEVGDEKTELTELTDNTVLVKGQDYFNGASLSYYFKRLAH